MTSTFVLDQNNSDTELGKSRINMTLFRFYNKWKKVQRLGALLKQVLPRVIMSSTKESDNALSYLSLEWTGRALPQAVFLLAREPQAFPCKLVSPTQASHNQYSTRKHWQTTHSNKQQEGGKMHQRSSLWTVSQLSLSRIASQIVCHIIYTTEPDNF